jgi:phage terminase large subunit
VYDWPLTVSLCGPAAYRPTVPSHEQPDTAIKIHKTVKRVNPFVPGRQGKEILDFSYKAFVFEKAAL